MTQVSVDDDSPHADSQSKLSVTTWTIRTLAMMHYLLVLLLEFHHCICALFVVRSVSITQTRVLRHSSTTTQALTTTIWTRSFTSIWHVRYSTVCVATCCLAAGAVYCRAIASSLRRITSTRLYILLRWATASLHSSCAVSSSEVERVFRWIVVIGNYNNG